MTEEERQLLKDTSENLLRLLRQWDDTIAGMHIAISELYRAGMVTSERKAVALSRLKLRRDLIRRENKPTEYLDGLIDELDKWTAR
ncbi:hypothetical protein [Bradyrhizobium sp. USDA 10063]